MTMNAKVPDTFLMTLLLDIETESGQSFSIQAHNQNGEPMLPVNGFLSYSFNMNQHFMA